MTTATTERKGDWIQTYRGGRVFPLDPRPEEIFIEDVGHALGNMCRFNGHCSRFYSVGEHSVWVSRAVEAVLKAQGDPMWMRRALKGLLHDGSEAFIVDVPRPLKVQPVMTGYRICEKRMQRTIDERFGCGTGDDAVITAIDNDMLHIEGEVLMTVKPAKWNLRPPVHVRGVCSQGGLFEKLEVHIGGWDPLRAEHEFLQRFKELYDFSQSEGAWVPCSEKLCGDRTLRRNTTSVSEHFGGVDIGKHEHWRLHVESARVA